MYHLKLAVISTISLVGLWTFPSRTEASPFVISDYRVRSLDVTPSLGRGYSIMTNAFLGHCLVVDETTTPSYNYDYSFYDLTTNDGDGGDSIAVKAAKTFSGSLSYPWLQTKLSGSEDPSTASKTRHVVSSMRIERYYSSVREDMSSLHPSAATLLDRTDYVGFFKACGPTYVRGLRRVQEVNAFFMFTSSDEETSSEYAQHVKSCSWLPSEETRENTKFTSESQSLEIVIQGWGLGLSEAGSESLVAQSMADYQKVMNFAFRTMTQAPNKQHIGMVYGMEVVPWVENSAFQVAARVLDISIEIPLARSLIPMAYNPTDAADTFETDKRTDFVCKASSHVIDKFGYCCAAGDLYNLETREYGADGFLDNKACKPVRKLDPNMIKDNLAANGEFIARLDRAMRFKLNQMNTLEKCISAARAIPERYDYHILKNKDVVKQDGAEVKLTAYELKIAVDPFKNYSVLKSTAKELDEFLNMYVRPCFASLYGAGSGFEAGSDASFLSAFPWHAHDTCTKLSCLGSGMRWDRGNPNGGCVAGLMAGTTAKSYVLHGGGSEEKDNCDKTTDNASANLGCNHKTYEMAVDFEKTKRCWDSSMPAGRVDYYINAFCMPELSGDVLEQEAIDELYSSYLKGCEGKGLVEVNVAKGKSATQISVRHEVHGGDPYRAVDGKTDGVHKNKSVTHTHTETNNQESWWEVNLGKDYAIKKIKVWNRTDCCMDRLVGFKILAHKLDDTKQKSDQPAQFLTDTSFDSSNVDAHKDESSTVKTTYTYDNLTFDAAKIRIQMTRTGAGKYLSLAEVEVFTHVAVSMPTFRRGKLNVGEYVFSYDFKNFVTVTSDGALAQYEVSNGSLKLRWVSFATSDNLMGDKVAGYAVVESDKLKVFGKNDDGTFAEVWTDDATLGEYLHVTDGVNGATGEFGVYKQANAATGYRVWTTTNGGKVVEEPEDTAEFYFVRCVYSSHTLPYKYTENTIRKYPTTVIAASWDAQYATKIKWINCDGITVGADMEEKTRRMRQIIATEEKEGLDDE